MLKNLKFIDTCVGLNSGMQNRVMGKFMKNNTLCCITFMVMIFPIPAYSTVIENLSVLIASGDSSFIGNEYSAILSYDDAALTGVGDESLNPVTGSASINFIFEGQTFNETNDTDFNIYPTLGFVDGILSSMNYLLVDGANGVNFNDPTVDIISISDSLIPIAGGFTINANISLKTLIVENFIAIVFSESPYTGNEYSGTLSYDNTFLTGTGLEILSPSSGNIAIDFLFEGQLFGTANDQDFNVFPQLEFLDGILSGIDYLIVDEINGVDFNNQNIDSIYISGSLNPSLNGFTAGATVALKMVPTPSTVVFLLIGMIGITYQQKKAM